MSVYGLSLRSSTQASLVALISVFLFAPEAEATTRNVDGHAFFVARHAQVGVRPNGAFGSSNITGTTIATLLATNPPFKRNANNPGADCLGFIVDRNKKEFGTLGTPQVDGDFFCPGTPFEGWTLTVADGAGTSTATNSDASTDLNGTLGTVVVGNSTTRHSVTWTGDENDPQAKGLRVVHVYSIADDGQSLRMVTTLTNTTGSSLTGIQYARLVDPDNATGDGGGNTFNSSNTIVGQGANAQVRAEFLSGALIALISSDPRATAAFRGSGSGATAASLISGNWTRTVGATTTNQDSQSNMGLAIDVGTLAAGDSTSFTIEYALTAEAAGVTPRNVPLLSPAMLLFFASMLGAMGVYVQRRRLI